MIFQIENITGKILENNKVVGTGFLITPNLFMTARHNVHNNVDGEPDEKEVFINLAAIGHIKGKTINLKKSYLERIDIVIIQLENAITNIKLTKFFKLKNSSKDYMFRTYGYPKEKLEGFFIEGTVISDTINSIENNDYILKIEEPYYLQSYKGLSGAPILIDNFIVGIIVAEETEENLHGISFKLIDSLLNEINIEERELTYISAEKIKEFKEKINYKSLLKYTEETLNVAGPRYSKINLENQTLQNLKIFLDENIPQEKLLKYYKELMNELNFLKECYTYSEYTKALLFIDTSIIEIKKIEKFLSKILEELKKILEENMNENNIEFFNNLKLEIPNVIGNIKNIFNDEIIRFDKKYGKNAFYNEKWRGAMASYQCEFPCANLDTLKNLEKTLNDFMSFFDNNYLDLIFSKTLLLKGIGGIGKTHTLCDITNYRVQNNNLCFLFFGNYFSNKTIEETILEKLGLKNLDFDIFLYMLNNIGEMENEKVTFIIDALNETNQNNYWNTHLESFVEKIKMYKYIKLIISCRNNYLNETLNEEVLKKFFILEHNGFEKREDFAIAEYFKYYNINTSYISKLELQKEFKNPLFLKMYCEIVKNNNNILNIDSLSLLFKKFFEIKNEKISKKFNNYISSRDNLIEKCILEISKIMKNNEINFIIWKDLRKEVENLINTEIGNCGLTSKVIIDELISENILKENDNTSFSFGFERFFDYIIAKNTLEINEDFCFLLDDIKRQKNKIELFRGSLEFLMLLFKENYNKELINEFSLKDKEFYDIFISSLPLRKNEDIDLETKNIFEVCLKNNIDSYITEKAFFTLFELSLRKKCILNAEYFHNLFRYCNITKRDCFLGYWMLKSYEKYFSIKSLLDNALYLNDRKLDLDIIKLWITILIWFTSLNDCYIRDNASKGLTNLIRLYPNITLYAIKKFEKIDDDYIQERLWGSVYASLILNEDNERIKKVVEYIHNEYILNKRIPKNVLLRDYFKNIAEFAEKKDILQYNILDFKAPYESEKIKKIKKINNPLKDKELYYNCTESDFAIYTIPWKVVDCGFSKEEVGELLYNEIINNSYSSKISELNSYIDYNYGSERSRDETVERIGKKYQKIYLYRILGQIYDNCSDKIDSDTEQGNEFREIDLTSLPYSELKYNLVGNELSYNFDNINKLSLEEWLKKEDIYQISRELLSFGNNFLLKGYFSINKKESELENLPQKQIWLHVNSYLIRKEDLDKCKKFFKGKDFWGRWLPEGFDFYENWIGEYPWSKEYLNAFQGLEERKNIPIKLIPTVHDFNNEKDSKFCKNRISEKFLFPSEIFFENLKLKWNGENAYLLNSEPMFLINNGKSRSIYSDKKLLEEYLNDNSYLLVWTILGEKRYLEGKIGSFPGSMTFSQSFILEDSLIKRIHIFSKFNSPWKNKK
ncbi:hypothetical protein OCK72_06735 [Fusobacterium simiae]|uniref:Serine protease n=1 Tax=Fusobacterium simiae TaxID=855 RepID=A0ABT4DIB1_FUSSI|nr:hypothetical protein [Fusobacterium simiae]MCY7008350.1 hypothetical protein [Fusobacterium simiae]